MEKNRIVVASDKNKVNLRPRIKSWIEQNSNLEVVLLSRLKISRIRGEVVPQNPILVFITVSLYTSAEFNDLWGFVKKLRKHLPQTKIVVHTPRLFEEQREKIFKEGADGWIDDELPPLLLGKALEAIAKGEEILYSSQMIRKKAG